jgi:hypothetical protein
MSFPSIVPGGWDQTVYVVENDFGRAGRAYVETDVESASLDDITGRLIAGEYSNPIRVIAFNTAEGWSRDVSEDIARSIAEGATRRGDAVPHYLSDFVEAYLGVTEAA